MFPSARTKGLRVSTAVGNYTSLKVGPGTLVSIAFTGGTGAIVHVFDSLTVTGTPIASFEGTSSTVAFTHTPFLGFQTGLSIQVLGTFTGTLISLTIE